MKNPKRCVYCGKPFVWGNDGEPLNLDSTPHTPTCDRSGLRKAATDLGYREQQKRRDDKKEERE